MNDLVRHECVFCRIAERSQRAFRGAFASGPFDEIIEEGESCVLIPDISPIRLGHILCLSKRHIVSASEFRESEMDDLIYMRKKVERFYASSLSCGVLEFEHGAVGLRNCGGCINHCHLHFVPFIDEEWVALKILADEIAPRLEGAAGLVDKEYLAARYRDDVCVWDAKHQRSQFFRRIIANLIHAPDRASWISAVDGNQNTLAAKEVELVSQLWASVR